MTIKKDISQKANYLNNPEAKGLRSWIFTTDHKRIGLLYMYCMVSFFIVAVFLGFLMRLELLAPGEQFISAKVYNQTFTLHGVIMIFLFIVPGIPAIFGNFFLPLQLGAEDVAFPRLNLLSWWVYVVGAIMALLSLFSRTALNSLALRVGNNGTDTHPAIMIARSAITQ